MNDMEEGSVYKPLPELTHASLSTEHLLVSLLFITRNLAETKHHLYYYVLLLGGYHTAGASLFGGFLFIVISQVHRPVCSKMNHYKMR